MQNYIQVNIMTFGDKNIKGHKKVLKEAITKGDEREIKVALDTDGRMLLDKLKEHLDHEERVINIIKHNPNMLV